MIITLSGIDCAGKSTQLDLLEARLRAAGRRVVRVWFRPGYSSEMDALRRFVRRVRPTTLPSASDPEARREAFRRPGVSRAWLAMAALDTLLQYAVKVRAHHLAGRTVLCDRYLQDGLLDLRLRFSDSPARVARIARVLEAATPEPDAALLLTIPHETMLERMALKDEPFPDAPEVRDRRFEAYRALAASGRVVPVEAAGAVDEVHRAVARVLEDRGLL